MVVASVRDAREDAFDATSTRRVEDEHHNKSKQPFIGLGVSSVLSAFYTSTSLLGYTQARDNTVLNAITTHCLKLPQKFNHL